ncbi:MAG: pyruvate kinase [Planctomycetota bacterium]
MEPTRTKIVATVGPASGDAESIRRLVAVGVDVFRLNFSHGDHATHAEYIQNIREAAEGAPEPVAVLQDLQGPRIRTGPLQGHRPVELTEGAEVELRPGEFQGDAEVLSVSYPQLPADVRPGDHILLADGTIELRVLESDEERVRCRVSLGGELGEHKGINLPGVDLSIASPTDKDVEDLRFGIDHGVDFVALSFVRTPAEIERLKEQMRSYAGEEGVLPVIPKIEKPEALQRLHEIMEASDGAMVARGDLGIEMRTEEVPGAQKRIIRMANRHGLPVITATQMLESMIDSPRPTRAEASDVANAILDGTDAVMLSGETSIGRYPVQAVRTMDNISREIEHHCREEARKPPEFEEVGSAPEHALANAACAVGRELEAAGIVAFTITGNTARYVSQRRPQCPIFALTPEQRTYRRLALVWGVLPVMLEEFESTDQLIRQGGEKLLEMDVVNPGDTVVYVAGATTGTPGGTDMLKIGRFDE